MEALNTVQNDCNCFSKDIRHETDNYESDYVLPSSGFATVALVGNANTGKTTLFNSLTGLRQHVGNYPGVTVSKYSGPVTLPYGKKIELVDLPGIYSLAATSPDERVVIDIFSGCMKKNGTPRPDAIVCVLDVNNLQRNLFLATQVAEFDIPIVLALNQIDVARRNNISINTELLKERFGIPVIPISARKGEGLNELKQAISDVLINKNKMKKVVWNEGTKNAIATFRAGLPSSTNKELFDVDIQRMIFDVASPFSTRLKNEDIETLGTLLKNARACIYNFGESPHSTEALQRYSFISKKLENVITYGKPRITFTSIADKFFLHRVFGILFFFAAMYGVFYSIYTLSGIPMDWIDGQFETLKEFVSSKIEDMPILNSLLVDGIISGVGGVLIFLPQILILFFFLGILESTGYMARAAFLMDKLFSWCGLNGKSFVPMLSGYACGIPGIMGARTIEDPKVRLATILVVPFMSCGARMPVYVLMCAILERLTNAQIAAATFVGMYFIGIIVSIPVALIYTKFILKAKASPFVLEMPRYQLPRAKDVLLRVLQSGWEYTRRAGTIIFAMSILIWALTYFPRSEETEKRATEDFISEQAVSKNIDKTIIENAINGSIPDSLKTEDFNSETLNESLENKINAAYIEDSYIGRFGKFCQPVFALCGFDWKITVGVLGSFPARELIVSTLGITYSLGGDVDEESDDLFEAMAKSTHNDGQLVFTIPVIIGIMVFFALCGQCLAEIVVIARETNWKWASIAWLQMTFLAWLGAVLCYQIGSLFL